MMYRFAFERDARQHTDPVTVLNAAVTGMKAKTAQAIEYRLAFVGFDRERKVRSVSHHDIGAGIDRRMRDLGHVLQHILLQSPVARRDHEIGFRAQRRNVVLEHLQVLRIGPGKYDRRDSWPVARGRLGARFMQWQLVSRVALDDSHSGRVFGGLMIGRPIDRGPLQDADFHPAALEYHWRPRRICVRPRARMRHSQLVQPCNRRFDWAFAVVHVIGDADRLYAAEFQRFAARLWIGEETLALVFGIDGIAQWWSAQAAFHVAENHICRTKFSSDMAEWNRRIIDVHQVDVAGKDYFEWHNWRTR